MGSITGFNSSVTGAFSQGNPLSAAKLNKLASGVELTKTQFSDGLLFQGGPSGVPYTVQYPTPLYIEGEPQQFQVKMNGNDLYVARGRVICRKADTATTYPGSEGGFPTNCLREYDVRAVAIWPDDSFVEGTEPTSPWMDDNGYFTLTPPEEGLKQYGVYLVMNQYNVYEGTLSAGTPYLAIMELNGDAWNKTQPWGGEDFCDNQNFFQISRLSLLSIPNPSDPYDPELATTFWVTHADTIDTESFTPMPYKLQNYNCQRVPIALIGWDAEKEDWSLTQYAIGTITIPYNIFYNGLYEIKTSETDPSWIDTPLYDNKQNEWEGLFTDCLKWDGEGDNPTQIIPV